ncbi:MAG: PilZ domain-containing protein [Treponema sp.]|nr:PilZ domain-containing protein [Treponema sp.]
MKNLFLLQESVQYFKEDDPLAGTLILVSIGVILLIVLVTNLVKNGVNPGKRGSRGGGGARHFSAFALHRAARTYGLRKEQIKVLEYVLRSSGINDPEHILATPSSLDKVFKRAYKQIEKSANTDEEAQQRMGMLFSVRNTIEMYHNTTPAAPSTQHISSNMAAVLAVNGESYPVKVISSKNDGIQVDCPRNAIGSLVKFPRGTRASLAFFTKTNKGFSFDTQVLGSTDTSFGPALVLSHSGRPKAMTQRRFRRRQAALNCDFHLVRIEDSKNKKQPPRMVVDPRRMTGSLTDVSIGGCAIKTSSSAAAGSRIKIELSTVHTALPIAVLGQVLRINRGSVSSAIMHVKFLKVPRNAMNVINALVFEYVDD